MLIGAAVLVRLAPVRPALTTDALYGVTLAESDVVTTGLAFRVWSFVAVVVDDLICVLSATDLSTRLTPALAVPELIPDNSPSGSSRGFEVVQSTLQSDIS